MVPMHDDAHLFSSLVQVQGGILLHSGPRLAYFTLYKKKKNLLKKIGVRFFSGPV
jgi:hypothetical protein